MNLPRATGGISRDSRVFVAGGQTLLGQALLRGLQQRGFSNLCGVNDGPNLIARAQVEHFFQAAKPEYVFFAAGKSMGIRGNQKHPATLMLDNLLSQTHVIDAAWRHGTARLLYLASSCCYPRDCPQPMKVEHLTTGPLEPTNEAYATAKLAGIRLCQAHAAEYGADFIPVIPANPFGIGDDFDPEDAHVIPALLRKMHEAKKRGDAKITLWGTGRAQREFVFADDLADACLFVMEHYRDRQPLNLGGGRSVSIAELAGLIKEVVGFSGALAFDALWPDGMPVKMLDSAPLLALGWRPKHSLGEALALTYQWFVKSGPQGESASRAAHGSCGS